MKIYEANEAIINGFRHHKLRGGFLECGDYTLRHRKVSEETLLDNYDDSAIKDALRWGLIRQVEWQ
jgi:hypothetical protein